MSKLVLMCGVPCSGKTTVSRYIQIHGYERLSFDEVAEGAKHRYSPFIDAGMALHRLHTRFDGLSSAGKDIVVDFLGTNEEARMYFFRRSSAEKYLVHLRISQETFDMRAIAQGRQSVSLESCERVMAWEPPTGHGYSLLSYQNNSSEDLAWIKSDLAGKIFRP